MLKLKRNTQSKNWYISGTIANQRIRVSSGTKSKKEAEEVLRRVANEYYAKYDRIKLQTPTLEMSASEYIDVKNLHLHHITQINRVVKKYGHLAIDEIKPNFGEQIKQCLPSSLKNSSINRAISVIQAIVNYQWEKIGSQKITIKKYKEQETKITWHSEEEYKTLLQHSGNLRTLITFLYYTGCRISEAINLDWRDIDYDENLISVYMQKTRTHKYIYIHPELRRSLGQHQKKGKVFFYKDRYSIRYSWRKMCQDSGIPSNPHKFRHTFATRVLKNSDLTTLMSLGGWSSEKMALRYAKVVDTRKADAIKKL